MSENLNIAEKNDLLVVDDTPENLRLLVGMLKDHGYKVRPVPNGKLALKAVEAAKPDLILLDINMPDMNGYQVCEALKASPDTSSIPVIFLSALNETIDKVKAFTTGGVDYITKPFQIEEVISRIRTHLSISQLQEELEDINKHLEERVRQRTAEVLRLNAEKEQIEAELKVAGNIQMAMLPTNFPAFPEREDISVFASMEPAKNVGGDFYDFFLIDDTHLFFAIGDVSGKGVPAALFMARIKTLLKDKALLGLSPDKILCQTNNSLVQGNDSCMFATVFCGILDTETGLVNYSCGGHNPPLFYTPDQDYQYLALDDSIVVGVFPCEDESFPCGQLTLDPDTLLFLYSDGVTEAVNEDDEFYSDERLQRMLNQLPKNDVRLAIDSIREDVDTFSGNVEQADDITMLALCLQQNSC